MALAAVAIGLRLQKRPLSAGDTSNGASATTVRGASVPGDLSIGSRATVREDAAVREGAARMIHGDARHTHRAHGHGPRALKVAWTVAVGGSVEAQVTASPDEQTLYVASFDGTLTALSRGNGSTRWKVTLGDRIYSTPCVGDDGMVYVGSDAKLFYAITADGRIAWKLETDGDADTGAAIGKDKRVYFAAGNVVTAVRPGGDVAWRFQARAKVFTAPALTDDGNVIVGAQDHKVYALTPSGALAWNVDLGADVDGAPAIGDDGAIFVGTDLGEVVRLGPSGAIAWRANVGGFVRGALSVARDGDVLAGVYGPTPRQVRLDAANGAIRSAHVVQGTGAREFGVHGGALEDDDGTTYFGAQDDFAYAVEQTGALRWKLQTGADVDAPLTMLSDGSLVVASDDGKVYLLAP